MCRSRLEHLLGIKAAKNTHKGDCSWTCRLCSVTCRPLVLVVDAQGTELFAVTERMDSDSALADAVCRVRDPLSGKAVSPFDWANRSPLFERMEAGRDALQTDASVDAYSRRSNGDCGMHLARERR